MKTINNISRIALAAMALSAGNCLCAQNAVTVVDRPVTSVSNNYTNFREPLKQVPLLKLPVGKVQPKGWLRKYLELQKEGLNGKLGTISAWLDKNNNQWLSDSGDPNMLAATYNDFNIMREHYGQVPGGMYGADESCTPPHRILPPIPQITPVS